MLIGLKTHKASISVAVSFVTAQASQVALTDEIASGSSVILVKEWALNEYCTILIVIVIRLKFANNLKNLYRIYMALIFYGSKFSLIAALKEFVEKISRIRVAHVCYRTVAEILVE